MNRLSALTWVALLGTWVDAGCASSTVAPSVEPPASLDDVVSHPNLASGSRLRAVSAEASDGTSLLLHWWDTQFELPCAFEPTGEADEAWRCLPRRVHTIYDGADELFADARCTEPLLRGDGALSEVPKLVQRVDTQCWIARDYFRVGARFAQRAYRNTEAGCTLDSSAQNGAPVYTLEPLRLDAWVAGEMVAGAKSGRIASQQLVADDGSRAPHGLRDLAGGFGCWPRSTVAGLRCLPTDYGWGDRGGVYSDSRCSVPASVSEESCGGRRDMLSYVLFAAAGGDVTAVRRGGARLSQVFQQLGDNGCSEAGGPSVGFAVGEPVALEDFLPAALVRVLQPSGLVQIQAHVSTAGAPDTMAPSHVDQLASNALGGYDCTLATLPDGVVRCVPPLIERGNEGFSDPECTEPVWQSDWKNVSVRSDVAEIDTAASGRRVVLPRVDRVLAGGVPYAGTVFARRGNDCSVVPDVPNTRQPYHRFDGEARLSELPALQIIEH